MAESLDTLKPILCGRGYLMTLKQKAFVKALTDPKSPTYCKPSASYRVAAPGIRPGADRVGAHRLLTNTNVAAVIDGEMSLDELGRELSHCLNAAKSLMDSDDATTKLSAARTSSDILMNYAKLTGKIVDRQEVKTITDADSSAVRDLVSASMTATVSQ